MSIAAWLPAQRHCYEYNLNDPVAGEGIIPETEIRLPLKLSFPAASCGVSYGFSFLPLKQFKLHICVYLFIIRFFTLLLHIFPDCLFAPPLPYRTYIIPVRPEFPSP